MKQRYSFLYLLLGFLLACCTKTETEEVTPDPGTIKVSPMAGKIILPTGSTLSFASLAVVSPVGDSPIKESAFSVDTVGKFSTVLVMNEANEILLMRYNYPGQKDTDISAQSTALALVMNLPVTNSLASAAKIQLVQQLLTEPAFAGLVAEVTKALQAGKPITDPSNSALQEALGKSFTVVAQKTKPYRPLPLIIKRAGKVVQLRNNYVAHAYVAGVYKNQDTSRKAKLMIEGTQMFATTLAQALSGIFGPGYSSPDEQYYTMGDDGEYHFRIRSGKPGTNDKSAEFKEAQYENIAGFIVKQVATYVTIKDDGKDCDAALEKVILTQMPNLTAFNSSMSASEMGFALIDVTVSVFENINEVYGGCIGTPKKEATAKFFKGLGKLLKFLNPVDKIAVGTNAAYHAYDLINSKAAIDTCFQVLGNQVVPCQPVITGWYEGKYTLGIKPNNAYNCGSQVGEQGDVYYYAYTFVDPDPITGGLKVGLIQYSKSILDGIPNLYRHAGNPVRLHSAAQYYQYSQNGWGKCVSTDNCRAFGLGTINLYPGSKITMLSGFEGWAYYRVPFNTGECDILYQGWRYSYATQVSAVYKGKTPPTALSAQNIATIERLVADGYSGTEIEE